MLGTLTSRDHPFLLVWVTREPLGAAASGHCPPQLALAPCPQPGCQALLARH